VYLLDTVVVSELRAARSGSVDPGLVAWAGGVPRQELFLSAQSLLDLQDEAAGIARHDKANSMALSEWIEGRVVPAFDGRILPIDLAVARRSATLAYPERRDALVVATALEHGLTLVTQRPSAYKTGRPKLFSPWGYVPAEEPEDWREAARGSTQWFKNLFVRV
jgi:predicted nucleic acid-binding protein